MQGNDVYPSFRYSLGLILSRYFVLSWVDTYHGDLQSACPLKFYKIRLQYVNHDSTFLGKNALDRGSHDL